jgi:hypothetical protein
MTLKMQIQMRQVYAFVIPSQLKIHDKYIYLLSVRDITKEWQPQ